jgi:hypothetical protein
LIVKTRTGESLDFYRHQYRRLCQRRNPEKQHIGLRVIGDALRAGNGVISTQVLQQYANVALGKLAQRQDVVLRQLAILERLEVVSQTPGLERLAVELRVPMESISGMHPSCLPPKAVSVGKLSPKTSTRGSLHQSGYGQSFHCLNS